ncbi:hypothetical protein MHYP_G00116800 [Metynnis hypsauchen]
MAGEENVSSEAPAPQPVAPQRHFLKDVIFHGKFHLLNCLTPEETAQCRHGLYFQDGERRVDYVLTYQVKKPSGSRARRHSSRFTDNALTRSLRRTRPPSALHQARP